MAETITINLPGANWAFYQEQLEQNGSVRLRIGDAVIMVTSIDPASGNMTGEADERDLIALTNSGVTWNSAAGEPMPTTQPGQVAVNTANGMISTNANTVKVETVAWNATDGYPGVVALFQQRLWFAGSPGFPDRIWGSQVADYYNFKDGVRDDEAVEYQLAFSGVNQIRWMKALPAGLAIGTSAGELTLEGGADNPLTPTNVRARERTFYGSDATLDALRAVNLVIFVQRGGLRIREFTFALETDNYVAPDLLLAAEHLTRQGIVDFARAASPDSLLFVVTGDGMLAACVYERPENVVAWSHHRTGEAGDGFERVCVIPNACGTGDEVWVVVRRTIGGVTKRYIEVFDGRLNVDSGLTYEGEATGSFSGLDHLNGEAVFVVTDDGTVYEATVSGGSIDLTEGGTTTAAEVGLNYTSTLLTVRPEVASQAGTGQGRRKHWDHATVRVFCTESQLLFNAETILERPEGVAPTGEYTGDLARQTNFGWDREGQLIVQTLEPKTVTILGITGAVEIEDA
jgi:hypothetical protein